MSTWKRESFVHFHASENNHKSNTILLLLLLLLLLLIMLLKTNSILLLSPQKRDQLFLERANYMKHSPGFSWQTCQKINREFADIVAPTNFTICAGPRNFTSKNDTIQKIFPDIFYHSTYGLSETLGQWIWNIDSKQWEFDDLRNLFGFAFRHASDETEYQRLVGHATAILSAFPPDCYDDNM
jgi:hypothetical protein